VIVSLYLKVTRVIWSLSSPKHVKENMVLSFVFYYGLIIFALFGFYKESDFYVDARTLGLPETKFNRGWFFFNFFQFLSVYIKFLFEKCLFFSS
jgi:hypothetical protein